MPRIGNVDVSDDVLASLQRGAEPTPSRPSLGQVFGAAAKGTIQQVEAALPYQFDVLARGQVDPVRAQIYKDRLAAANETMAAAAPAQLSDLTSGRVGFGRFVLENLAASAPQMGAELLGAAAGGALAGPRGAFAGTIAAGAPLYSASNVARAVQEKGTLDTAGASRSAALAIPQAALDVLEERYLPGAGKLFGSAAATQAGGFIRRTAVSAAKSATVEAIANTGQQLAERAAAGIPITGPDAAAEYVNAGVSGLAIGGVLGAGGGFRRTNAVSKPVDMVTPEDLTEHIDGMLNGSLRALPSPQMFGREAQGPQVESGPPIVQDSRPNQIAPDFIADSEGRVAPATPEGQHALVVDQNQPQRLQNTFLGNVTPEVRAALEQGVPPSAPPLTSSTTLSRGLEGTHLEPPAPFAPLSSQQVVPPQAVPGSPRVNPQTGEEVPFDKFLAEQKKGLRGGFVQTVKATDELDLLKKVYDQLFVEQDTRANTAKFGQRLGLLDENLEPTELAQHIEETKKLEAQRASEASRGAGGTASDVTAGGVSERPAPPADTTNTAENGSPKIGQTTEPTEAETAEMQQAMKKAGIQRLSKSTVGRTLNTPADVFNALADPDVGRGSNAAVTQVEKLARKLGLVTDDDAMDITPKGREVHLRSPEGLGTIVSAATDHGFTGAAASQFERGARTALGGEEQTQFGGFDEMAAYHAGQVWAKDFVANGETKTAAQTAAIQARQAARTTGKAVEREKVARPELTPLQVRQAALNRLIDAADLRTVNDSDVAALRRMAREGASTEDVGKAIQNVQAGRSLFEQGETKPVAFQPARPVRGGQPAFREMNTRTEAGKAAMRAETEGAARAYHLRSLVEFAKAEKGITEARAEKLHTLLDQGKVDQVARLLKDFDPGDDLTAAFGDRRANPQRAGDRRNAERHSSGLDYNDPEFEQAIAGKNFHEVLDHIIEHAPSAYHRAIMRGAKGLIEKMVKAGTKFEFHLARPGDAVPEGPLQALAQDRAVTSMTRVPPSVQVWVKGAGFGEEGGVNYQVVAHEMLHAATMMVIDAHERGKITGGSELGKAVDDLNHLAQSVLDHFNKRFDEGNLSPFEQRFRDYQNNALENTHELISWGLTNPDMQRYLASIEYTPRQSVWSKFVDLIRRVIGFGTDGIEVKDNSALAQLLRVSERIMDARQSDLTSAVLRNRADKLGLTPLTAPLTDRAASAQNRTVDAANEATKAAASLADKVTSEINVADLAVRARRAALGWISSNQMVRQFGARMPGLLERNEAHRERVAVRARFEQMGDEVYQEFEKLERENPKTAKLVGELMATATEFQLDPDKAWAEHQHLLNDKNAEALKRLHGEVQTMRDKLRRGDGAGWKSFNDFRALNEAQNYSRMAAGLHSLVAMDPELALGVEGSMVNPVDQFMHQQGLTNPAAIRDWWNQALHRQIAASVAFVNEKKGEAARGTESDQNAMRQHLSPIELQISAIHEALASMNKAPYFHLGRFGDYFGSGVVAKNADGTANPVAMQKLADALEKAGFDDVQISTDNTKPRFMLRFDTVDQVRAFRALALQLQKQGILSADDDIKAGPRGQDRNFGVADGLPDYVARYIQSIEASPMFVPDEGMSDQDRARLAQSKQDAVRLAIDTWLEQQPDSSISKVLVKRYTVPGYKKDMIRNFAHRWRVGSISLANVAAAPKLNRAYTNMRAQVNDALVVREGKEENAELLSDLLSEMKARDASTPINPTADTFDKLRAYAHAYFLGFSPAYGLINLTQMGVVALPELAKKYGYAKSFHAMRRATGTAFKVLGAAAAEAQRLGPKHYADVAITESVLEKAGLSANERNFVMRMLATGTIDIGSAARALGQIAENRVGSKTDVALKYASAVGQYTETFSRLATALAANDLHEGTPETAAKYATDVVSNSMFDYQNWNTARQLGKKGFLGPITPIVTQFMSYSVQVTEKLYSEMMAAAAKQRVGETAAQAAQRRREARTFLLGHLTAVTALAGTLGLPFATVFATAIERLVDAFDDDDQPYDATASWRNFLSSVLGKQMGEVVARGLPRAIGADVSTRAGEQSLLPFSEFLADRRPWKDAVESYTGRSLGAVPSMLSNIVSGGGKIADGDVLGGMKDVMPVAFKGPIEAYRMTSDGYMDSNNNKLPLSPTGASILWQLLGFTPSAKAEYSEARGDQAARRGAITRHATNLRQRIVKAMIDGDQEKAAELVAEAQKFDADNPAFAVIPGLAGSLQGQLTARSRAQALQTPLGVPLNDIAGQGMTRYANVNYTQ